MSLVLTTSIGLVRKPADEDKLTQTTRNSSVDEILYGGKLINGLASSTSGFSLQHFVEWQLDHGVWNLP
jgi:hypothetical protein